MRPVVRVTSSCPLAVASRVWCPAPEAFALTVVCKATFTLAPKRSPLAPAQDGATLADTTWPDAVAGSLEAASDLAPFKRYVDVIVTGSAYATRGKPVASLVAKLKVGSIDKSIEVHGDRRWTPEGWLSQAAPFVRMPLRWERAAGGQGTLNPAGVPANAPPDARGSRPAPNILPPGCAPWSPSDVIPAVGFGPIAPSWPERSTKLRWHAQTFAHDAWYTDPLPRDIDAAYFNAAPSDQQIERFGPGEVLSLKSLHVDHPQLTTTLDDVTPHAHVARSGGAPEEVRLRCDTVVLDTDRGTCTLTWRGVVHLRHRDEPVLVTVTMSGGDADRSSPLSGRDLTKPEPKGESVESITAPLPRPVLPFDPLAAPSLTTPLPSPDLTSGLPVTPPPASLANLPPTSPVDPALQAEDAVLKRRKLAVTMVGLEKPLGEALPFRAPDPNAPRPLDSQTSPFAPSGATGMLGAPPLEPVLPFRSPAQAAPPAPASTPPAIVSPPTITPDLSFGPPPVTPWAPRPDLAKGAFSALFEAPKPLDPPPLADKQAIFDKPPPLDKPSFLDKPSPVSGADKPAPLLGVLDADKAPSGVNDRSSLAKAYEEALSAKAQPKPPEAEIATEAPAAPAEPEAQVEAEPEPLPLNDYPLARCAAIAAAIDCAPDQRAKVLGDEGLVEERWDKLHDHHLEAIREEVKRWKRALTDAYDAAYVGGVEAARGPIGAEEYARITVAMERGEDASKATSSALAIPIVAWPRIRRVWTAKLARDGALGASLRAALRDARDR